MLISWQAIQQEALDCLCALIRLDTTNPPGNERIAADYLADALGAHGIDSVIRESAPTRANLVARYPGADSSAGALLLSSHTDVVPVERSRWTRAPFGAEIADGCVWGRGSIDMKSKCAMDLVLMIAMRRAGVAGDRDVISAPVPTRKLARNLVRNFSSSGIPNWSAGLRTQRGRRLHGVSQGPSLLSDPGRRKRLRHGQDDGHRDARPWIDAAPDDRDFPNGRVDHQDRGNADAQECLAVYAPDVRGDGRADRIARAAVCANACQHGLADDSACRLQGQRDSRRGDDRAGRPHLPGENPESFMAELRQIVGPEPTFELLKTAPPAETSSDTPLFELIKQTVEAADPGARAIAWMIPGSTDNKFYSQLGAACYGFSPVKLDPQMPFGALYHGNDERLPIEGFYWGLKVYAEVVLKFLGIRFDEVFA